MVIPRLLNAQDVLLINGLTFPLVKGIRKGIIIRIGHFTIRFDYANVLSFQRVETISHTTKANIWVLCQGISSLLSHWH